MPVLHHILAGQMKVERSHAHSGITLMAALTCPSRPMKLTLGLSVCAASFSIIGFGGRPGFRLPRRVPFSALITEGPAFTYDV